MFSQCWLLKIANQTFSNKLKLTVFATQPKCPNSIKVYTSITANEMFILHVTPTFVYRLTAGFKELEISLWGGAQGLKKIIFSRWVPRCLYFLVAKHSFYSYKRKRPLPYPSLNRLLFSALLPRQVWAKEMDLKNIARICSVFIMHVLYFNWFQCDIILKYFIHLSTFLWNYIILQ